MMIQVIIISSRYLSLTLINNNIYFLFLKKDELTNMEADDELWKIAGTGENAFVSSQR
jgi:hypothetical protein